MPTSTRHAFPSPSGSSTVQIPVDIKALADSLDLVVGWVSTTTPTPLKNGLVWYNPTTGLLQITDGTSWYTVGSSNVNVQHGTWTLSFAAEIQHIGTGQVAFPVAFAGTPDVLLTAIAITGNTPVAPSAFTVSSTGFWLVARIVSGASFTGTVSGSYSAFYG